MVGPGGERLDVFPDTSWSPAKRIGAGVLAAGAVAGIGVGIAEGVKGHQKNQQQSTGSAGNGTATSSAPATVIPDIKDSDGNTYTLTVYGPDNIALSGTDASGTPISGLQAKAFTGKDGTQTVHSVDAQGNILNGADGLPIISVPLPTATGSTAVPPDGTPVPKSTDMSAAPTDGTPVEKSGSAPGSMHNSVHNIPGGTVTMPGASTPPA